MSTAAIDERLQPYQLNDLAADNVLYKVDCLLIRILNFSEYEHLRREGQYRYFEP
jgi:hypothetical protein